MHFCLIVNEQDKVEDCDAVCDPKCLVHKDFFINVYQSHQCQCDDQKFRKEAFHQNTFMQLIYATEIIAECSKLMKYNGRLASVQGKLPEIFDLVSNKVENHCVNGDKKCRFKQTSSILMIEDPLPEVFMMNVTWLTYQVEYEAILKFIVSIPHTFLVKNMFKHSDNKT